MKFLMSSLIFIFLISCGEGQSPTAKGAGQAAGQANKREWKCQDLNFPEFSHESTSEQSLMLSVFRALQVQPKISVDQLQFCLDQIYEITCENHQCVVRGK